MPIDIIKPFIELLDKAGKAPAPNGLIHGATVQEVPPVH
jgi:hypothetical protein